MREGCNVEGVGFFTTADPQLDKVIVCDRAGTREVAIGHNQFHGVGLQSVGGQVVLGFFFINATTLASTIH